jgi:hypothetical protein
MQGFADYLLRIGDGNEPTLSELGDDVIRLRDDVCMPTEDVDDLIDAVYPGLRDGKKDNMACAERAILCPLNHWVDEVNARISALLPGQAHVYHSADCVGPDDNATLYPTEYLNSLTVAGIPPHELSLKEDDVVILLRNIDPPRGLCNGTRMFCRRFHRNFIECEIAVGSFSGNRVLIPHIPHRPKSAHLPFQLSRRQFPLRLAYAISINKAQGQSLKFVGVYLHDPVFSHGQLYVAFSRVGAPTRLRVMVRNGHVEGREGIFTHNIVYKEVL